MVLPVSLPALPAGALPAEAAEGGRARAARCFASTPFWLTTEGTQSDPLLDPTKGYIRGLHRDTWPAAAD